MNRITINNLNAVSSQAEELFKTLRTNIEFTDMENRVITVTSCLPNDGKSNVSYHLAEAFAVGGKNVVLIDADMRKSVLMNRLQIEGRLKGLSHYLSGQVDLMDVIYSTNVPQMFLMPPGPFPPNPAELLGNARFRAMIPVLRKTFDYVIIDTPPLGSVIDAALAAKYSDGSLLVISADSVSRQLARSVKARLEMSNRNILGVVLNKVERTGKGYYGKYKYYGYGSYYGSSPDNDDKKTPEPAVQREDSDVYRRIEWKNE